MNKIKQNKITFTLIISAIVIIFSSLTILSLPVLFNYESKVIKIEKNFYKNFKIYLNSSGKISYKPFPKPHLLVEKAAINLQNDKESKNLINTSSLKIFISLRDIYLRSFVQMKSIEISNTNLELKLSDLKSIRRHLYQKINKKIVLNDCKVFLRNKKNEVILISPLKKTLYKINRESKTKNFIIEGNVFGLNFKSHWKRNYDNPLNSYHNVSFFNPKMEIQNIFQYENAKKFNTQTTIFSSQDKSEYNIKFENERIKITSPKKKNINFSLNSDLQLNPFYFQGLLNIKNKKIEDIIDKFLSNLFFSDDSYLGNLNGILKIKFDKLNNKLIKQGEISLIINEEAINLKEARFYLDKIGYINSSINFIEDKGDIKFVSKNKLEIENHIEFAKTFQVGSKKVKKINHIYFDLEKNIGDDNFIISNVKINDTKKSNISNQVFLVKNIQNLRFHIRKVID